MLPLTLYDLFTAKYGCDFQSYIAGTERKKIKKKYRSGRQKKGPAFCRRPKHSNIRAQEHFISGGGLFGLLPNEILEGVGDSLSTARDRCSYCVSVPNMYRIVGREGVADLRTERWHECMDALRQK